MFKNKKFEVKILDDKDPEWKIEQLPDRRPSIDRLDIEMLSQEIAKDIVTAYILIKSVKTFCSILEHVVVTKVK